MPDLLPRNCTGTLSPQQWFFRYAAKHGTIYHLTTTSRSGLSSASRLFTLSSHKGKLELERGPLINWRRNGDAASLGLSRAIKPAWLAAGYTDEQLERSCIRFEAL